MFQQGRRDSAGSFCPFLFHLSLVAVVVGRKNASTSFLISHTGPGMHMRLQWFAMQLTSPASGRLNWWGEQRDWDG